MLKKLEKKLTRLSKKIFANQPTLSILASFKSENQLYFAQMYKEFTRNIPVKPEFSEFPGPLITMKPKT